MNYLFLCLLTLWLIAQEVRADCQLETTLPTPFITTKFGSKNLVVKAPASIKVNNGESVMLHCEGGFVFLTNRGAQTALKTNFNMSCEYDQFRFNEFSDCYNSECDLSRVWCKGSQSQMYESHTSLPSCQKYMTLVIGQDFDSLGSYKSVALCYDFVGLKLKYIAYTAYPSKNKIIEKEQVGQLNALGLDIHVAYTEYLFKSLSWQTIDISWSNYNQLKEMFGTYTFDYENLIQDESLVMELSDYQEMTSIVWLHALRTGNWRHWLSALRQVSKGDSKYDVQVGVSGEVVLPLMQQCNKTRILNIDMTNGNSLPVPAQIWAHVQSLTTAEDFVMVGHNSPFFKAEQMDEFCASICDEISWLKNSIFSQLQHYSAFGLMQCCRVQDVANKLDNFPKASKEVNIIAAPTFVGPSLSIPISPLPRIQYNEQGTRYHQRHLTQL